jgi:hypothetical protein
MEKIKDYFKRYPVSQEVYENGGVLFHTRGAADSYGTGETKRYTRKETEGVSKAKDELTAEEQARLAEEAKNTAIAKLKAIEDLNSLEYPLLFKLSQDLGLKSANNKKPTILEVLTAEKERLNAE